MSNPSQWLVLEYMSMFYRPTDIAYIVPCSKHLPKHVEQLYKGKAWIASKRWKDPVLTGKNFFYFLLTLQFNVHFISFDLT